MKIRNGFVSNSSSSSFIISYPKDKIIRLKDIENYFGGYNEDIPEHTQDIISFEIWKKQFDDTYNYTINIPSYTCDLLKEVDRWASPSTYLEDICPNHLSSYDAGNDEYPECWECKHHKIATAADILDIRIKNYGDWNKEWAAQLENLKKDDGRIKELKASTEDPSDSDVDFNEACMIRQSCGHIFKSHDRILEEDF